LDIYLADIRLTTTKVTHTILGERSIVDKLAVGVGPVQRGVYGDISNDRLESTLTGSIYAVQVIRAEDVRRPYVFVFDG
jgi:hypothetical protein